MLVCYGQQYAAVERLERAIESIQSTIEDEGGNLVVKMKVGSRPLGLHNVDE